jgi:hypothetical protein
MCRGLLAEKLRASIAAFQKGNLVGVHTQGMTPENPLESVVSSKHNRLAQEDRC